MKTVLMLLTLPITFAAQAQFSSKVCYKAINPQAITIANDDNGKSEKARSADFTFQTETSYNTEQVVVIVKSKTMTFDTMAIHANGDTIGRYGVECDGGSTIFKKGKDGLLVANSEYMGGEVKVADEGCSTGSVKFKNLILKKAICPLVMK